jgi:hypothetical protein
MYKNKRAAKKHDHDYKKKRNELTAGFYRGVVIPHYITLQKYGLEISDWKVLADAQAAGSVCLCPVCEKPLVKSVLDHEHVKGWKKMSPEIRKQFVRCLAHMGCNWHFIAKNTLKTARNIVRILETYEIRKKNL